MQLSGYSAEVLARALPLNRPEALCWTCVRPHREMLRSPTEFDPELVKCQWQGSTHFSSLVSPKVTFGCG
jgi:hypothetical protein